MSEGPVRQIRDEIRSDVQTNFRYIVISMMGWVVVVIMLGYFIYSRVVKIESISEALQLQQEAFQSDVSALESQLEDAHEQLESLKESSYDASVYLTEIQHSRREIDSIVDSLQEKFDAVSGEFLSKLDSSEEKFRARITIIEKKMAGLRLSPSEEAFIVDEEKSDRQDVYHDEMDKLLTETARNISTQSSDLAGESVLDAIRESVDSEDASPTNTVQKTESELVTEGWNRIYSEEFGAAVESFLQAIEVNPESARAFNGLGYTYLQAPLRKDYEKSALNFRRAIEISPDNSTYWSNLGWPLLYSGDFEGAIDSFNRALEIRPKYARPLYGKGLAFLYLDDPKRAIELLRNSIIVSPDKVDVVTGLGIAYARLDSFDLAIRQFENARSLDADYIGWMNHLGRVKQLQGELDQAFEFLGEARGRSSDDPTTMYYLSLLWEERGNTSEAESYRERFETLTAEEIKPLLF